MLTLEQDFRGTERLRAHNKWCIVSIVRHLKCFRAFEVLNIVLIIAMNRLLFCVENQNYKHDHRKRNMKHILFVFSDGVNVEAWYQ